MVLRPNNLITIIRETLRSFKINFEFGQNKMSKQ
jgi:hypothetical protein